MAKLDLKYGAAPAVPPINLSALAGSRPAPPPQAPASAGAPVAIDDFLRPEEHQAVWTYLNQGQWEFGAYSDPNGDRYHCRHFAGIRQSADEALDQADFRAELGAHAPIAAVWDRLAAGPLKGQRLARCYANAMGPGVEGGVHQDSNIDDHLTAIYYPHLQWDPSLAGETLLFNADATEVVLAAYPKPNRLVIFPGTMPHVARAMSKRARLPARITLMFKTLGA